MNDFLNKFKIPTVLGLGIIIFGIAAGVVFTLREQNIISSASPSSSSENITLTNVSATEVTISWQTPNPAVSFLTFGLNDPGEVTVLDDRNTNSPVAHLVHYVTLKNLFSKTTYQYKIVSGKFFSEVGRFETTAPLSSQTGLRPVIGSVLDGKSPLDEGIAYLSISDAQLKSSLIKTGNFLIPLSQVIKSDLSDSFPLTEDSVAKLTIVSPKGEATALFKLGSFDKGLPPLKIGENSDLTSTNQDLEKYDLNGDGKIDAIENAKKLKSLSSP